MSELLDPDIPVTLWCEFGGWQNGHPFSEKDPDYEVYRQTKKERVHTGNSYGTPTYQNRDRITETIVICGKHVQEMTRSFRKEAPEIPPPAQREKTLEELEEEDAEYRRGYDAAMEKVLNKTQADYVLTPDAVIE